MKKNIKNNFFMLKYLYRARKQFIFWEIGKSIVNSLVEVSTIYLFKILIDTLTNQASIYDVIPVIIAYAVLKKTHEVLFQYVIEIELPKARYALEAIITKDVLDKAKTIDLECFDNTQFYNNYTKALAETGGRSIAALNIISTFIFNFISTLGLLSLIITMDPLTIVLSILFFLSSLLFINKNKTLIYERDMALVPHSRKKNYCKNIFFSRSSAKEIRMYDGISEYLKSEYANGVSAEENEYISHTKKIHKYNIIKSLILILTEYILPLVYFSFLCLNGYITIGSVTALWESMKNIANNASGFSYAYANLKQSSLYIDNIKYILNYTPRVANPVESVPIPSKINKISFVNVTFKYPETDVYVLKNLTFDIYYGEKIAFVGHNGAGKSTLIKLLLRFYDPSSGYIMVNDIDIKKFEITEYRKCFVTMFQDFSLFSAPISINVSTKSDTTLSDAEKIVDSLKKVGLYERIKLEEKGIYSQYTKTFDQNGVLLSGGEMQKLALARVFTTIHSGTINIFDEPSAALDVESEELFYQNLINNTNEGISLFISHRLSTTINADCIFMLENGEILEKGTHLELMNNNGRYAYIFKLQSDKYKYDTLKKEISINKYE